MRTGGRAGITKLTVAFRNLCHVTINIYWVNHHCDILWHHTILSNHSKPEGMKTYIMLLHTNLQGLHKTKLPFFLLCHLASGGKTCAEAMPGVFYVVL